MSDDPTPRGMIDIDFSQPTAKEKMNINEITIGEARELAAFFNHPSQSVESTAYEVGKNYFIRTVTHHYTGKLVEIYRRELVLIDAAWIADDGRFADAIKSESFAEVEPWPKDKRVIIGRDTIIDATKIATLPRDQK
jgi:hypothetical protein